MLRSFNQCEKHCVGQNLFSCSNLRSTYCIILFVFVFTNLISTKAFSNNNSESSRFKVKPQELSSQVTTRVSNNIRTLQAVAEILNKHDDWSKAPAQEFNTFCSTSNNAILIILSTELSRLRDGLGFLNEYLNGIPIGQSSSEVDELQKNIFTTRLVQNLDSIGVLNSQLAGFCFSNTTTNEQKMITTVGRFTTWLVEKYNKNEALAVIDDMITVLGEIEQHVTTQVNQLGDPENVIVLPKTFPLHTLQNLIKIWGGNPPIWAVSAVEEENLLLQKEL